MAIMYVHHLIVEVASLHYVVSIKMNVVSGHVLRRYLLLPLILDIALQNVMGVGMSTEMPTCVQRVVRHHIHITMHPQVNVYLHLPKDSFIMPHLQVNVRLLNA